MKYMTLLKILLIIFVAGSLGYAAWDEFSGGDGEDVPGGGNAGNDSAQAHEKEYPMYVAWYFHGTRRCRTCLSIENFTGQAIRQHFGDAVEKGELEMRTVNVELAGNEHFIEDFDLVNKSVVLAEYEGGRLKRWKNLDRIWELADDRERFIDYVKNETAEFMMGESVE